MESPEHTTEVIVNEDSVPETTWETEVAEIIDSVAVAKYTHAESETIELNEELGTDNNIEIVDNDKSDTLGKLNDDVSTATVVDVIDVR